MVNDQSPNEQSAVNVFNSDKNENEQSAAAPPPSLPDGVAELVGEGRKYKSVEDLLKSVPHAQSHIEKLEREQAELRAELEKREAVADVLSKIQASGTQNQQEATPPVSGVSPEDLDKIISQKLQAVDEVKKKEINIAQANAKVIEVFGADKGAQVVAQKAAELGVNQEWMSSIAAQSPSAFLNMMGINGQAGGTPAAPAKTTSNTVQAEFNVGQSQETYQYFSKLRRENPKEYFKPATQNKMHKLAEKLGPAFYTPQ